MINFGFSLKYLHLKSVNYSFPGRIRVEILWSREFAEMHLPNAC